MNDSIPQVLFVTHLFRAVKETCLNQSTLFDIQVFTKMDECCMSPLILNAIDAFHPLL